MTCAGTQGLTSKATMLAMNFLTSTEGFLSVILCGREFDTLAGRSMLNRHSCSMPLLMPATTLNSPIPSAALGTTRISETLHMLAKFNLQTYFWCRSARQTPGWMTPRQDVCWQLRHVPSHDGAESQPQIEALLPHSQVCDTRVRPWAHREAHPLLKLDVADNGPGVSGQQHLEEWGPKRHLFIAGSRR